MGCFQCGFVDRAVGSCCRYNAKRLIEWHDKEVHVRERVQCYTTHTAIGFVSLNLWYVMRFIRTILIIEVTVQRLKVGEVNDAQVN